MKSQEIEQFKDYLVKSGVQLVAPTNEWELIRFKTENGVSVVYTNKKGQKTFTHEAEEAWKRFRSGKGWATVSRKRKHLHGIKEKLAERDGKKCFFCEVFPDDYQTLTLEHLLSFAHHGTDNLHNLALACEPCNLAVGSMPLPLKIRFRDYIRFMPSEQKKDEYRKWVAKNGVEAKIKKEV